jgi:hypothetical protein
MVNAAIGAHPVTNSDDPFAFAPRYGVMFRAEKGVKRLSFHFR